MERKDRISPYRETSEKYNKYFTTNNIIIKGFEKQKKVKKAGKIIFISSFAFLLAAVILGVCKVIIPAFIFSMLTVIVLFVSFYIVDKADNIYYDNIERYETTNEYKNQKANYKAIAKKSQDEIDNERIENLVEIFSILSDKRSNKKTKAKKLKKYADKGLI